MRDETRALLLELKQALMNLYESLFEDMDIDILDINIIQIRPGSIIVDHELILSRVINETQKQQYTCSLAGSVGDNELIRIPQKTMSMCSYCGNGGIVEVQEDESWSCQCTEDYKGDRCEREVADDDVDMVIIIIIVACCVVPLLLILCICFCLQRNKPEIPEKMTGQEGDTTKSFNYAGMSGARKMSSRKIFDGTPNGDSVDVPRQI